MAHQGHQVGQHALRAAAAHLALLQLRVGSPERLGRQAQRRLRDLLRQLLELPERQPLPGLRLV
ncbi:MAG TPA: hypothetical protein VF897_04760, partial [Roseiflexaceae bacterium]